MKIEVGENREIRLRDVFNSVVFETDEGEELIVCMRDGAFEIAVLDTSAKSPDKSDKYYKWYIASGCGIILQTDTPTINTINQAVKRVEGSV